MLFLISVLVLAQKVPPCRFVACSLSWFNVARSKILDRAGNRETGLFSLGLHRPFGLGQLQTPSKHKEIQMLEEIYS